MCGGVGGWGWGGGGLGGGVIVKEFTRSCYLRRVVWITKQTVAPYVTTKKP